MKIFDNPSRDQWSSLCERPQLELDFLESAVRNILTRVKKSGDSALRELTKQFDKIDIEQLQVTESEIEKAIQEVPADLKHAIELAASNIEKFHRDQLPKITITETMPGVTCWRKAVGIEKVGIYIPGGSAPLFSTVLMLGIPAKIAGCKEVILCTPPDKLGAVNSAILFTAKLTGIKKIFKVGGAQAIAALAYGTESIPAVYKIFGPGNQYVTKAKQCINQDGVAIDMPAGPSEVLVMADQQAKSSYVAADLLSQAEHGADSQVILVAPDKATVDNVLHSIQEQVQKLPRKEIALEALKNSRAIILPSQSDSLDFINNYAPEHLIINTSNYEELVDKISNAGSIFLGPYSPESAGDYASGTNHTLPTNGFAKAYSGVSLESFIKYITIQRLTKDGIKAIGPAIEHMAEAEQLKGHAEAVRIRTNEVN